MNNKELYPTVTYKNKEYPYRDLTIFSGTEEEVYISVSTQSLGDAIIANNDENCDVDNYFACFIEDSLFEALTDAQLAKHIEEFYYN